MWRALLVCAALACAGAGRARAQPSLCQTDVQCSSGYYCEAHYCRECLRCEDLKRGPPAPEYIGCITSPAHCGDCLMGLVYDSETGRCVASGTQPPAPPSSPRHYHVWVAVVACLAVVAALVAILLVYLYRNPDTFKMTASARASVHHAPATYSVSESAAASAPPPQPPPYDLHYPPPPPEPYVEEWSPLVKRGVAEGRGEGDVREAAGAQAAQVFNKPNYVHGPFYPHSPEPSSEHSPAPSPEPFAPHDEDTMESPWRPSGEPHDAAPAPSTGASGSAGVEGEAAGLAVARRSQAVAVAAASDLEPAAKMPRLSQDTNNNKNATPHAGGAGGASGTSVTLNFNLNVSTSAVQQLNNVSL